MKTEYDSEYQKNYREMHKDVVKSYNKSYYIAHRNEIIAKTKAYQKLHPRKYDPEYTHRKGSNLPMSESKRCSSYLGVYIAERALSGFFDNIIKMPYGNPGFDFICGKGKKIDVKSSCLYDKHWEFVIKRNTKANYFLCLAFNNRQDLEPMHVWLIPGKRISHLTKIAIFNTEKSLSKWKRYEKPLDKVYKCCNELRSQTI